MGENLYDLVLGHDGASERCALQTERGRNVSYSDLRRQSALFAGVFVQAGVEPGDRLAAQVEKSPEAIALYLAAIRIGAIYIPLNTGYTEEEVAYFVEDAEPRVIVCTPENFRRFDAYAQKANCDIFTLSSDCGGTLCEGAQAATPFEDVRDVDSEDVAAILYTSGTTGRPKGAMLTHGNLTWNARTLAEQWGFTEGDVLVHALPLFHAHGLFLAVNLPLASGARVLLIDRFSPESTIPHFASATVFMGVPTLYKRLLESSQLDAAACANMRLFVAGSAPLNESDFLAFRDRTGHEILERYGMTETVIISSNPLNGDRLPGSVGYPLPSVELRVSNDGRILRAGEVGMLEVRGPNVFKGYWHQPEKTKQEFRDDGFLVTGDLAKIDEDGRIWLVGRAKELIISGGYNVYPKEVERIIDDIDGIRRSAVIGVPHPDFGEGVVAVVERQLNASVSEEDVIIAAAKRLAKYKVPKQVYFEEALPANRMGKITKHLLIERYRDAFASS